MLCTLDDIKDRIGLTAEQTESDDVIDAIIAGLTGWFEAYCGRPLLATEEDVTETYTGAGPFLGLDYYPIIEITSIKEAVDWDFDSADALVEDTDWRLMAGGRMGILWRTWGTWEPTPDSIQAVYRGGYAAAGAEDQEGGLAEGEIALPAEIREAAIQQGVFLFKRKDDVGLSGVSFEGGSFNKFQSLDLLPSVKEILDKYKRINI